MNNFRVIDLFCGCGGLSEGFRQAGYEIVMGLDINEAAIQTYHRNLKRAYQHKYLRASPRPL